MGHTPSPDVNDRFGERRCCAKAIPAPPEEFALVCGRSAAASAPPDTTRAGIGPVSAAGDTIAGLDRIRARDYQPDVNTRGYPLRERRMGKVFISSTLTDLRECRAAAHKAIRRRQLAAIDSDDWEAQANPPLSVCLAQIDALDPATDVVVAIVARWYGSVPAEQQSSDYKSFTWLECERAIQRGIKVLPFLLDDSASDWPSEFCEDWRVDTARERRRRDKSIDLSEVADLVDRNEAALAKFRAWLNSVGKPATFRRPYEIEVEVLDALEPWSAKPRPGSSSPHEPVPIPFDRAAYLRELADRCEPLDLLGHDSREAHGTRLRQVYVPAVLAGADAKRALRTQPDEPEKAPLLLDRVDAGSLYLTGDAGSGKSTFCKWLALVAAGGEVPVHPGGLQAPEGYSETCPTSLHGKLPVLCMLRELGGSPERIVLAGNGTLGADRFVDALAKWADDSRPYGLTSAALRASLQAGECLLILDGADELPYAFDDGRVTHAVRDNFLSGLAAALRQWGADGNRVLLTSRPYGLSPAEVQKLGLPSVGLAAIPDDLQNLFVRRWYAAVDPPRSVELSRDLWDHLSERQDDGIAEMRRNPMLLTAICVKFHEGKTLPKNVYDLYDAVIDVVVYGRFRERHAEKRIRKRLSAIALGMHTGEAVRSPRATPAARVTHEEVCAILQRQAAEEPRAEAEENTASAEDKFDELLTASGLLIPAGDKQAQFYHLSLQEFLAAERLRFHSVNRADIVRQTLQQRAGIPQWRRTLGYLFAADLRVREEHALNDYIAELRPHLDASRLRPNPEPALVLADAIEIAHANGLRVSDLEQDFFAACEAALATSFDPKARTRLWEVAGRVGFDRRPGVGLDAKTGLPDIVWCEVAGAEIELENNSGKQPVQPFAIAKYPVTHDQFQAFIDADNGYRNPAWWDDEWLPFVDLNRPPHARWTAPNGPRETVNWFEAMAYCRWLTHEFQQSGTLAGGRVVRLPAELEWQCAAWGSDPRRKYPWLGAFAKENANTEEGSLGRTSPVGLYLGGNASCGASDMAGNLWEWCANRPVKAPSAIADGDTRARRTLCGGSWLLHQDYASVAARGKFRPSNRSASIGFRVCCASPIVDG